MVMNENVSKTKKERIRIQIDFWPERSKRLEDIAKKAGDAKKADTVRNVLRLYDWYLSQIEQGYKLQLARPKDKYVREVDLKF